MAVGGILGPGEEEWLEPFTRLRERFPAIRAERVLQVLRENDGHAGHAASDLRDLCSGAMKEVDPDDAEHVATLLSNKMMFKQTCQNHFDKFDANRDGVLQWNEILNLSIDLCQTMGLDMPNEMHLKSFFDGSDDNKDGVLTQKEFIKFFEAFLRFAFFEQHRKMVGKWKYPVISADLVAPRTAEFEIVQSEHFKLYFKASKGGCPGGPLPDRLKVSAALDLQDGWLIAELSQGSLQGVLRLRPSSTNSEIMISNFKAHSDITWRADVTSKRHKVDEDLNVSRPVTPVSGMSLRCLSRNGVTYRHSPEYNDRKEVGVRQGETVIVEECSQDSPWVRTCDGWLPLADSKGHPVFGKI